MDLRFRILIIGLIAALAVSAWTFPVWYPALNQETLTEFFPGLDLSAQPAFATLPQVMQDAYFELRNGEEANPAAALALVQARLLGDDVVSPEANQPFTAPSNTILRRGEFITVDAIRGADGTVTIYQLPNLTQMVRLDDFSATRAPDLHLILTRNPDPFDERGVGVDYYDIGELKGNVGAQSYLIPTNINYNLYPIMAIYSVELDYVISTATLR